MHSAHIHSNRKHEINLRHGNCKEVCWVRRAKQIRSGHVFVVVLHVKVGNLGSPMNATALAESMTRPNTCPFRCTQPQIQSTAKACNLPSLSCMPSIMHWPPNVSLGRGRGSLPELTCASISLGILPSQQLISRLTCTGVGAKGVGAVCVGATSSSRGSALVYVCISMTTVLVHLVASYFCTSCMVHG